MEEAPRPVLGPDVSAATPDQQPDRTLYDVAAVEDVKEGEVLSVLIKEQSIALIRVGGEVHAVGGRCPHKGAPLRGRLHCHSKVHGDVVVCPWHKAVFGVRDGKVKEPVAFSSLPVYPVRLVEGRVLVGVSPISAGEAQKCMEDSSVLVLGGGAAAASAIYTLREEGFGGSIVLIGEESLPPYDRPSLSKGIFLGGPDKVQPPLLLNEAFFAHHEITRVQGRVVSLDCKKRRVELADGRDYSADHVLIATGGQPVKPALPGIELDGVMTLHGVRDARQIAECITGEQAVILIGGGLTTLELASALRQKGAGVTIIAPEQAISMEAQWGREVGRILQRLHADNGVAFVTDSKVVRICGTDQVEGIELDDGMKLPCTHVLVAIGSEPCRDFLPDHIGKDSKNGMTGIVVDKDMRVMPGVYAAGDVAIFQHEGTFCRVEHWRQAQIEGRAAARTILGLPRQPMPVPWYWTQQFGKKLEYIGWGGPFDRVLIEGDLNGFDFMAAYMRGPKVVALVSAGRSSAMARAAVDFDDFVAKEVRTTVV
ncbi:FAD-dependent oxidoreductase [Bombella intestini]|uniref:FAD-dependent oxidoreductase n=1 Tax=Bombella intestini TaxID=1539051 RepID=UPI00098625D1|nr:FAD-dependent oxidoreductase [Bombella intestini]